MAETAKKSNKIYVSARNKYQISNPKIERFYKCFAAVCRLAFTIDGLTFILSEFA